VNEHLVLHDHVGRRRETGVSEVLEAVGVTIGHDRTATFRELPPQVGTRGAAAPALLDVLTAMAFRDGIRVVSPLAERLELRGAHDVVEAVSQEVSHLVLVGVDARADRQLAVGGHRVDPERLRATRAATGLRTGYSRTKWFAHFDDVAVTEQVLTRGDPCAAIRSAS